MSEVDDIIRERPLTRFSLYTHLQSEVVRKLGRDLLDRFNCDPGVWNNSLTIPETYGSFWLWVIGAFEIVRTMTQRGNSQPFDDATLAHLDSLKSQLELVRIPFTKQELPKVKGVSQKKNLPVGGEPSIAGIGQYPPDMVFSVNGRQISARQLIHRFEDTFSAIRAENVLADHRANY